MLNVKHRLTLTIIQHGLQSIYIIFFSNFVALLCVALFLFKPFISILKYDFHNFSSHVVAKKVHDVKKHSEATSDRDRESSDY